jgi:hypothetical protein
MVSIGLVHEDIAEVPNVSAGSIRRWKRGQEPSRRHMLALGKLRVFTLWALDQKRVPSTEEYARWCRLPAILLPSSAASGEEDEDRPPLFTGLEEAISPLKLIAANRIGEAAFELNRHFTPPYPQLRTEKPPAY